MARIPAQIHLITIFVPGHVQIRENEGAVYLSDSAFMEEGQAMDGGDFVSVLREVGRTGNQRRCPK